ncbi:hypothetical protein KIL84_004615 [Mauremys mutica]|uniref:Phosphatidylcholine transfer protein n=1 Tax=Mauremys mutica TaxID=74926 RepID=A0A9D3XNE1_9SAUR|nr:hypothetical protein KIL84_004615 [Mauremys mutica]
MDLDYRKQWDQYVKELSEKIYDGKRIIYWEVKYPFPLSNRDYVYLRERRDMEVDGQKIWVMLAKSVSLPQCPEKSGIIRVNSYVQSLVLASDGKTGSKVYMYYFDNPGGMIPSWLINWAAKMFWMNEAQQSFVDKKPAPEKINSPLLKTPISQIIVISWYNASSCLCQSQYEASLANCDCCLTSQCSWESKSVVASIGKTMAETQQVEDDRTKALPALGEQQNSNNDIRVCVHLGISDKAAWRNSISVEEGLFQLKPKEYQKQQPLSSLARGKDELKPLHLAFCTASQVETPTTGLAANNSSGSTEPAFKKQLFRMHQTENVIIMVLKYCGVAKVFSLQNCAENPPVSPNPI